MEPSLGPGCTMASTSESTRQEPTMSKRRESDIDKTFDDETLYDEDFFNTRMQRNRDRHSSMKTPKRPRDRHPGSDIDGPHGRRDPGLKAWGSPY